MVARRRARGDDVLHTRHLRGANAHDGAGCVGIAAARHIAACGLAGDQALPRHEPGQEFGAELVHRVALAAGKVLHAVARKADVVLDAGRQGLLGCCKRGLAEHDLAGVAIQVAGIAAHRLLAARLDVGQHLAHSFGRGRVDRLHRRIGLLQVVDGHGCDQLLRLAKALSTGSRSISFRYSSLT
jgi:hypothetical protein